MHETLRGCARARRAVPDPFLGMEAQRSPEGCTARDCSPGKPLGSFLLRAGTPSLQNDPIPSPVTTVKRNPVSTRLRGSHISFNSNIRVLNIHREIGIGWHLQCFQIHSFQVQRQIKNHSGREQLWPRRQPAPRHPAATAPGEPRCRKAPAAARAGPARGSRASAPDVSRCGKIKKYSVM